MTGFLRDTIDGFISRAGAVRPCDECGDYDLWADDKEAEGKVYAMVTNAYKCGAFGTVDRASVRKAVTAALDDVHICCPVCGRHFDGGDD